MWAFLGRRGVRRSLATGVCVLAAAAIPVPGIVAAARPAAAPRFVPDVLHVGRVQAAAPDSAQCEQQNRLPCYDPAQIGQAYGLSNGQDSAGAGVTIAIIDTYGSPTISSDLATFDSQYDLPAPKLTIIQPAGQVRS